MKKLIIDPTGTKNQTELMVLTSITDPENKQFAYWKEPGCILFENNKMTICKFKIKLKETCIHSM